MFFLENLKDARKLINDHNLCNLFLLSGSFQNLVTNVHNVTLNVSNAIKLKVTLPGKIFKKYCNACDKRSVATICSNLEKFDNHLIQVIIE